MSMHDPRTESRVKAERRPGGSADLTALPHIVLVHGAWADSSSWRAVIQHLQADGYRVTAPQFPLTRLADDVAPAAPGLGPPEGFRCMSSTRVGAHDLLGSTPSELARPVAGAHPRTPRPGRHRPGRQGRRLGPAPGPVASWAPWSGL